MPLELAYLILYPLTLTLLQLKCSLSSPRCCKEKGALESTFPVYPFSFPDHSNFTTTPSEVSVSWSHRGWPHGNYKGSKGVLQNLWITETYWSSLTSIGNWRAPFFSNFSLKFILTAMKKYKTDRVAWRWYRFQWWSLKCECSPVIAKPIAGHPSVSNSKPPPRQQPRVTCLLRGYR